MSKFRKLVELEYRSQTVYSYIQILVIFFSCIVSVGLLSYTNVREAFSCVPKFNASIEQLCYDNYTFENAFPFRTLVIADVCFVFYLIFFPGLIYFQKTKHNRQPWRRVPDYSAVQLLFVCFRIKVTFFMAVITGLSTSVQSPYKCPLSNGTAPMLFNQTSGNELLCYDQRYKAKTTLGISLLTVSLFIFCLLLAELRHVAFNPEYDLETLLDEVLGTSHEPPAVTYSVKSPQETPSSPGVAVLNSESSVTESDIQNVETASSEQNPGETAYGCTCIPGNVLVSLPGSDKRHLVDWQEN